MNISLFWLKYSEVSQNWCSLIQISMEYVPMGSIDNNQALVRIMAIIWTNDDLVWWRICASLGLNKRRNFNNTFENFQNIEHILTINRVWVITHIRKRGMKLLIHPQPFEDWNEYVISLSGVPDFFDRNKILSGGDLSHYQVPHCIRVFFCFVWFVFIHHNFQFCFELCTYCNILDIYLS